MLVIDVTVHAHFKQIITEIEIHPFANIGTLRRALLAKVHDLVGSHVVVDCEPELMYPTSWHNGKL